jgi:O-methyltransferase
MKAKSLVLNLLLKKCPALYFRLIQMPRVCTATQDGQFWDLHARLLHDQRCTQMTRERYNLWTLARQAQKLVGAYAEAGVYDGGSARILCEAKGTDHLHLFDTFEGMPETDPKADPHFTAGQFANTNRQKVADYLAEFPNVHIHQGFFPASAADVPANRLFKFVHLDLDIYRSTLDGLRFFYPRLVRKGVIISHDYGNMTAPGVKKAFDEFLAETDEPLIQLWDTQCLLIKTH